MELAGPEFVNTGLQERCKLAGLLLMTG